ncbi:vacuolar membrane protein-domain-containing protein [Gilbertella persicaria]|uniref:vacuolar membrane protein-domain-containing protein n=1 Tax=Gilbertella persicaria TaxID=101096 RepID=UPI00221E7F19|nr:vacuolar membrane protein-domain-containing protein [Gilbertella persicaria]KAI8087748.1 vacuolar membrane protein-domain-containing protein [Gilbertella persicaria]
MLTESLPEPPTPPPTRPHHRPHPDDEGCKLLDSFAILVQMALVSSALITLFYKRSRERPQRPVLVWALDVSKQFAGAAVIHFLNLAISYIAGRPRNGGPKTNLCVWYFLNVAVDTTLGVAILWGWLHLIQAILTKLGVKQLETGRYGPPPVYRMLMPWFKQTCVFILAESLMKLCVYGMFRHLPFLFAFGEWVLRWTKGNYRYQVIFVMLVFPLIMNMIQFWIVDTIVKVSPMSVTTSPAVIDQEADQQSEEHDENSPLLPK